MTGSRAHGRSDSRTRYLLHFAARVLDSRHHLNERYSLVASASLMVDDIDNQSALSLAQHYDSKGLRTIGIHSDDENSDNRGAHEARYGSNRGSWRHGRTS
jgi:hypothetical protein